MMLWLSIAVLTACFYRGGGVTKTPGIEQFWTDDYKVFEQIYGKTSDRDIYGASLPGTFNQGIFKPEASEKKERYHLGFDKDLYDYSDKFNELLKKAKAKSKPATSTYNFIKYEGFKPISKNNDPETYKYLQYLEGVDKEHDDFPKYGGFKPDMTYGTPDPKDTEAYKSIQDILDAHEKNQRTKEDNTLLNHRKNKDKKRPRIRNSNSLNRCVSGRCKKRNNLVRSRTRPYVRRIKHRYVRH